jgi:hypothetical protein
MVKAGKRMWNEIANANWMRDSMTGSRSITGSPLPWPGGPAFPAPETARAGT